MHFPRLSHVHRKFSRESGKSDTSQSKGENRSNQGGHREEGVEVSVSEKLVEVSYLLAQIEDLFLRCSHDRVPSNGPWVFLCYVATLFSYRIENIFPLQELLQSISRKHIMQSPKQKFRIFCALLSNRSNLMHSCWLLPC